MSSILREHAGTLQELTKVREITIFGYGCVDVKIWK